MCVGSLIERKNVIALAAGGILVLEDVANPTEPGGSRAAHERNEEIIIKKLASFGIAAQMVGALGMADSLAHPGEVKQFDHGLTPYA